MAIGPQSLNLAAGSATIVYAIGSAEGKSLALVAQTITGLGGAPAGMPAGTGGQARTGVAWWWYATAIGGVLLLIGGGATVIARRTSAGRA